MDKITPAAPELIMDIQSGMLSFIDMFVIAPTRKEQLMIMKLAWMENLNNHFNYMGGDSVLVKLKSTDLDFPYRWACVHNDEVFYVYNGKNSLASILEDLKDRIGFGEDNDMDDEFED